MSLKEQRCYTDGQFQLLVTQNAVDITQLFQVVRKRTAQPFYGAFLDRPVAQKVFLASNFFSLLEGEPLHDALITDFSIRYFSVNAHVFVRKGDKKPRFCVRNGKEELFFGLFEMRLSAFRAAYLRIQNAKMGGKDILNCRY